MGDSYNTSRTFPLRWIIRLEDGAADANVWIQTKDAYRMVRRLARKGRQGVIVTVLCDSAEEYLTEELWNDLD